VPDCVEALARAEHLSERGRIFAELFESLCPEDVPSSLGAKAVPFLIELVGAPETPKKNEILLFLRDLWANHPSRQRAALGRARHFAEWPRPLPSYPAACATREAVYSGWREYAALLSHDEPEVRASAAYLLALLGAAEANDALRAHLEVEPDPVTRATM